MAAKDYNIVVTAVTGTPRIAKVSKRNPGEMTGDYREIPKSEFIQAILDWTSHQFKKGNDTIQLTKEGKVVAEIKIISNKNQ